MTTNIKHKQLKIKLSNNQITELPEYEKLWEKTASCFGMKGIPGITYIKSIFLPDKCIESLTYRNEDGQLLGVIEFFPDNNIPKEKKGNVNIMVHPECSKQGIGLALIHIAVKIWDIDFSQQQYTPSGMKLIKSYYRSNGFDSENLFG